MSILPEQPAANLAKVKAPLLKRPGFWEFTGHTVGPILAEAGHPVVVLALMPVVMLGACFVWIVTELRAISRRKAGL